MKRPLLAILLLFVTANLISCGGGGGGAPSNDPVIGPEPERDSNVDSIADLNPDYDGYLYLSHRSSKSMLNLKQGSVYSLRTGTSSFHVTPDAKHFAMYYRDFDSDVDQDKRIDWFNEQGMTTRAIQTPIDLFGLAKLSNDGSLLAIGFREEYSDPFHLGVIDGNNQLLSIRSFSASEFPFTSWEWLANGDLIFAEENRLYRVSGLQNSQANVTQLYELPYAPYHITVSPDQSKISFNMYSGDTNHHIYVMELATGSYRQLTDSDNHEHGATWSPDGRFIALNNGESFVFCSGGGLNCISDCPLVYIVDSNSEKIWVSEDDRNQAYQVRLYQENAIDPVCSRDQLEWRTTPIVTASTPGTSPTASDSGTGYPGTLIFEGTLLDNQVDQVNLDNLISSPIPSRFDDPDMLTTSKEGQLLAMKLSSKETDYNEKIFIRDRQGNDVEVMNLDDSLGFPKISPDGKWLAVEYHDTYLGDEPAELIVSVFRRVPGEQHTPEFEARFKDFNDWEWTPDNRLILVRDRHVYLSDSTLSSTELYFSLPNRISALRLSPDGNKLAFIMNDHAFVVDDFKKYGSEPIIPRQLTASSYSESALAWSPDGRYMAVTYADSTKCHNIYLLPADGERVYIGNEKNIPTSAIPIGVPRSDGSMDAFCAYYGSMDWVN